MIEFGPEICQDIPAALSREWLETNGLGGFASSTIMGLNSRRYHGLLTAATKPPLGRLVLLSKLEEVVIVHGNRYELSCNQYLDTVHPLGYKYLKSFRLDPFPVFTYEVEGVEIEKTVFMIYGHNSTVIEYRLKPAYRAPGIPYTNGRMVKLEVRPLIAFRDYHSTTMENKVLNSEVQSQTNTAIVTPYKGMPEMFIVHNADHMQSSKYWYRHFKYAEEINRGLDGVEDLFSPMLLEFTLTSHQNAVVIATTEHNVDINAVDEYKQDEIDRRQSLVSSLRVPDEMIKQLVSASDQFIVQREDKKSIIAGYHWFSDWGRDTMISLPGLSLVTGRFDVARNILMAFCSHVDQGMIPNRFPDQGELPDYNTVDATLWFFEAIRSYGHYSGDYKFIKRGFYKTLLEIIDWHREGTRYGIKVDTDGLLRCGDGNTNLTWMDAKIGQWVVTPRCGKPVEVQALWYNALCIMKHFAEVFEDKKNYKLFSELSETVNKSFNEQFWNNSGKYLYDVIDTHIKDASIRPNQVFAVSLAHSLLDKEKSINVLNIIEKELLTPFGLRTLSPSDPKYKGMYEGNQMARDEAYHQGTVWAWLMGPYISAYTKINNHSPESRKYAEKLLLGFKPNLIQAGLGQLSEIFDGNFPHKPRGCIAQAWSVGELLRVAVEDIYHNTPQHS